MVRMRGTHSTSDAATTTTTEEQSGAEFDMENVQSAVVSSPLQTSRFRGPIFSFEQCECRELKVTK
jgi:hypothetical protein